MIRARLGKLPVAGKKFPARGSKIPCPCAQGICFKLLRQSMKLDVNRPFRDRFLNTPCDRECNVQPYRPSAARTSFRASSLAHSAGPASEAISQPFGLTSSVVGMPIALPMDLRSWNTLALESE
jgi:hypothetical protein